MSCLVTVVHQDSAWRMACGTECGVRPSARPNTNTTLFHTANHDVRVTDEGKAVVGCRPIVHGQTDPTNSNPLTCKCTTRSCARSAEGLEFKTLWRRVVGWHLSLHPDHGPTSVRHDGPGPVREVLKSRSKPSLFDAYVNQKFPKISNNGLGKCKYFPNIDFITDVTSLFHLLPESSWTDWQDSSWTGHLPDWHFYPLTEQKKAQQKSRKSTGSPGSPPDFQWKSSWSPVGIMGECEVRVKCSEYCTGVLGRGSGILKDKLNIVFEVDRGRYMTADVVHLPTVLHNVEVQGDKNQHFNFLQESIVVEETLHLSGTLLPAYLGHFKEDSMLDLLAGVDLRKLNASCPVFYYRLNFDSNDRERSSFRVSVENSCGVGGVSLSYSLLFKILDTALCGGGFVIITPLEEEQDHPIKICSDSQVTLTLLEESTVNAEDTGWLLTKNREIIEPLIAALRWRTATTTLEKVKAHVGIVGNEKADRLADARADKDTLDFQLTLNIPRNQRVEGMRLQKATQSLMYHKIKEIKSQKTPKRRTAVMHLDMAR
ncbi:hypothetical protein DFP72DRAFT_851361 [Ephemerocybe angulata]|uniref:RNase H type-1 domain-containing protein n=1 Tax=Ephemerocybe angulata TaxID=980116 RepID=A0A8H6HS17_9AGAR|nr:hypothetical protein DFP72DRAFT_851361 [Tulosesus angulatus]